MSGFNFSQGPRVKGGKQALIRSEASDPLKGVEYSGDLAEAAAELDAMQQAYRDRAKAEQARFTAATDSEYWFAVCFSDREEKEAFLREFNLDDLGDKYLAGADVARRLRKSKH